MSIFPLRTSHKLLQLPEDFHLRPNEAKSLNSFQSYLRFGRSSHHPQFLLLLNWNFFTHLAVHHSFHYLFYCTKQMPLFNCFHFQQQCSATEFLLRIESHLMKCSFPITKDFIFPFFEASFAYFVIHLKDDWFSVQTLTSFLSFLFIPLQYFH